MIWPALSRSSGSGRVRTRSSASTSRGTLGLRPAARSRSLSWRAIAISLRCVTIPGSRANDFMNDTITIEVNGERRDTRARATVRELLADLGVGEERIAVELNRALLARDRFGRVLEPGDRVEIVTFVGGG